MLMITVMAFATDYTDQLKYEIAVGSNYYPVENAKGTLSITQYDNGNYQVTAKNCDFSSNPDVGSSIGNLGDLICDALSGTTDGNGVTTIDVTDCTAGLDGSTWIDMSSTKLLVKFKGDKAYATFTGKYRMSVFPYQWRTVSYTFGTDEGFDGGSTGGGETGGGETGGETSSIVTVVENYQANGTSFVHNVTVDWDTQKIVASMNLADAGSDKNIFAVAKSGQSADWVDYGIVFYDNGDGTVSGFVPGTYDNSNTGKKSKGSDPVRFEVSKDGVKFQGNVVIAASSLSRLISTKNVVVGAEGSKPGKAYYNYIKVVPLDWTEVPPVTVEKEVPFTGVAFTVSNGMNGNADVTFKEMSDETVQMTFASSSYNISATNLTKDTDTKGRTTYTGTAANDAMSTVTYTVKAVVYTAEGGAQKLYMTLMAADGTTFTVGEDPDYVAPVTYKNTLYVVENAKLLVETADAEVVLLDKGDNKYDVTLPSFTAGGKEVPSITFEATKADNKLTASNVTVANVYNGEAAVVTMDGTFEADNKLVASLTVKCGELFDYEVGYGIKPFVATTQEFTAEWANVKVGDAEPVNFQNAKADYTEFAKGQYSLTFKDLTFGEKKIGDFTIKYVNKDEMDQLSTTASAGEWTRVETDQEVASKGDMPAISGFEGRLGGTGVLIVKFTIAVGSTTGNVAVDFGNKYEAPKTPDPVDVVEDGFKATGSSWKKEGVAIDWDTQYIAAKLDLSTCKTSSSPENVLAVGTDITGWNDGPHYFFYYNKADKVLQYNYLHKANSSYNSGFANLSKAYIQLSDEVVTIEISKQGGLKINGESALVKYVNTAKDPSTNSTESWTTEDLPTVFSGLWELNTIDFGGCQGTTMSNATYKYVKVVPLGWTEPVTPPSVKEEKTFNEALYMQDQKVANATVVVKEMSDETINMSLKFGENEYTSTELTKGTDTKGRTTYTGKVANGTQTYDVAGVVYEKDNAERLYMTLTTSITTVVVGENPDAVTPDPEVKEESNKTYTSNLRILDQTSEDEDAYLFQTDNASVNIIKYSDNTYKITLRSITLNEKTADLVFTGKAVGTEVDPGEGGVVVTDENMVQATADAETQEFLGDAVNAQFMWQDLSDTEIRMSFVLEGEKLSLGGEFNYEKKDPDTPVEPTFPMENYQADGKGFVVSTDIDWSKQKFQAIIDATKCSAANTEEIFGFGEEATAWFKNIHVYADKGSYKAYFEYAAGEGNNNTTVTIADQSNITIEVSKAEGLTVDGVVVIAAEQLTGIFDLTTVKFGSGENSQYSNALYKSVKLVDLPVVDGISTINAEVANGEAQLFTVNGVKLNKLQKGLNIVRTADGKVKKVLVK